MSYTFWCVSQCVANLTTAKLPFPIVLSRKYFPIFICRFANNPVLQLFEVIVDVRERAADGEGDADGDDVVEFKIDNSGGIEEWTDDNGRSLNI